MFCMNMGRQLPHSISERDKILSPHWLAKAPQLEILIIDIRAVSLNSTAPEWDTHHSFHIHTSIFLPAFHIIF